METDLLTAVLAVSPNLEAAIAALTLSLPTALAVPTGRHVRASVRVNAAVPRDSVEPTTVSAVLAVNLCSVLANPLRRILRPTAPAAQMARRASDSVKAAAVVVVAFAAPTATSAVLAVNLASVPVMIAPKMSQRTVNVAKTAKPARDIPKANAAHLVVSVAKEAISAALVVRQPSELVTAILGASRPTANAAKTARPVKATPEANAAHLVDTAAKRVPSATQAVNPPSGLATVALVVSRRTVHVARTARPARALLRVNAAPVVDFAAKTVPSVAQGASLPLVFAIAAP